MSPVSPCTSRVARFSAALLVALLCLPTGALAADAHDHEHDKQPGHHHNDGHHHHTNWEIGIAAGVVPLLLEDEVGLGLHGHLLRRITNRVRVGLGVENVFDEHGHFNVSAVLNVHVFKGLSLSVAPGLLLIKHGSKWETNWSSHFEGVYEFDFDHVHLGPVVEYSYSPVDKHLMFGLHVGLDL